MAVAQAANHSIRHSTIDAVHIKPACNSFRRAGAQGLEPQALQEAGTDSRCRAATIPTYSSLVVLRQVSPQELLQDILTASKRRFTPTTQCDPAEFTSWFLTSLHTGLGGTKKMQSSTLLLLQ